MTTAGQFIAGLQKERRIGNLSGETEQHLKHAFRGLGWDASSRLPSILRSTGWSARQRRCGNCEPGCSEEVKNADDDYQQAPSRVAMIARTFRQTFHLNR
jgi:hypothetical protein